MAARPLLPASRNISRIWYFIASKGSNPARIWPVMMPGKVTIPAADIWLITGNKPMRCISHDGADRFGERRAERQPGLDRRPFSSSAIQDTV